MAALFSTLLLILTFTAVPPKKVAAAREEFLMTQADSTAMLSKTWILREKLRKHREQLERVQPADEMTMSLHPDGSYSIRRVNSVPARENGVEVLEQGRWELEPARGLICMQTTMVDGKSILSTMMYRWQVESLSPQELVLKQFGVGELYLVLKAAQ